MSFTRFMAASLKTMLSKIYRPRCGPDSTTNRSFHISSPFWVDDSSTFSTRQRYFPSGSGVNSWTSSTLLKSIFGIALCLLFRLVGLTFIGGGQFELAEEYQRVLLADFIYAARS